MLDKQALGDELAQLISMLESSILTQVKVWTKTEEALLADSIKQTMLALNSARQAQFSLNLSNLFRSSEETIDE